MNFTLITTIFAFKRKKCEKVRVVKAHIGGRIMTFFVQDRKKNIQPGASDSNSESATDSYRVKCIVGPTNSNVLELNPSRDQAADSNRSKKLKKRYLSLVHLDTEGKGHESFEKTMCHGIIYMEKCNLVPIINHLKKP